jgi:hypothetical protein
VARIEPSPSTKIKSRQPASLIFLVGAGFQCRHGSLPLYSFRGVALLFLHIRDEGIFDYPDHSKLKNSFMAVGKQAISNQGFAAKNHRF